MTTATGRAVAAAILLLGPVAAPAQITQQEYAQRRDSLAAKAPDGVLVVLGAGEPTHDYEEFFQGPAMQYLTGIEEPHAALVLVKEGRQARYTLFVSPRDPAAETWSGPRLGVPATQQLTGVATRSSDELVQVMDSLAARRLALYAAGSPPEIGRLAGTLSGRRQPLQVGRGDEIIARLRGRKSAAELALIRRAVEITVESHRAAMRAARPGMHEYELEAVIEYGFRSRGAARPAFASIVGSGPNATVLHYNTNTRATGPGDVVVMDVGASYMGYSADVTRTIPVGGTYSPAQREVYQIVRDAQAAAERNARPGMRAQVMSDSAWAVIAAGLTRLGLIEGPGASYDAFAPDGSVTRAPQVSLFYMHGLGHGIGLEVHDPEQFYVTGTIGEGSAFSIEPGIYVRPNLRETLPDTPRNREFLAKIGAALDRYRNIGVRIEDDYIVTARGLEWISQAPRELDEIEALMRRPTP